MAHLTKPARYNIEDSNIALLGSDLEKHVRENAGDSEPAWDEAGQETGLQIWRIEQFKVVTWPKDRYGHFYNGDSYIVLNTYRKSEESDTLSYDLHFWLGEDTSQDEAATAAYKTVELDDHLHGAPIQYRQVQGQETPLFLSYFRNFCCLQGGVATGFHHVTDELEEMQSRLFLVVKSPTGKRQVSHCTVYQVPLDGESLLRGPVFVLDKGFEIWQFNRRSSTGKERFGAAEFTNLLSESRKGQCDVKVYEEGGSGAGIFLSELGLDSIPPPVSKDPLSGQPTLYVAIYQEGTLELQPETATSPSQLDGGSIYVLDASSSIEEPTIYVWIGNGVDTQLRRLAFQVGQMYLNQSENASSATCIVSLRHGQETEEFSEALQSVA